MAVLYRLSSHTHSQQTSKFVVAREKEKSLIEQRKG